MSALRRRGVDGPRLTIDVLCLVLPARRREWGVAARSELAAIDSPSDRRRFSTSCLRVLVADSVTRRNVCAAALVAAMLLAAALSTTEITDALARAEGIVLVAALAGLFLVARRARPGAGWLGRWISPVGTGRAHCAVRVLGYLGSSAMVLTLLLMSRTTAGLGPGTGTGTSTGPGEVGIVGLIALAMAVSLLAITAEGAAISSRVVGVGGACGVLTGLGWFGFVLVAGYVDRDTLALAALIAIAGCAGIGAIVAAWRQPASGQGVQAGLLAVVVAVLLIFTAPMATYTLAPSAVPDPNPGSYSPQLNQYAHDEQNAIEAEEPYILPFLAGGLLSLVLLGSVGGRRRRSERGSSPAMQSGVEDITVQPLRSSARSARPR